MRSLRLRLARIGALLAALAFVWACNAPPIVVPPPSVAFSTELLTDASGAQQMFWRATQPIPLPRTANATFTLYNLDRKLGYITTANDDGTFVSQPMEGM